MPTHLRRATLLVGASFAIAALTSGGVLAQEPSDPAEPAFSPEPVAPCGVLTAEEVSKALGETFTLVSGDPTDCSFDGDYESGRYISLYTDLSSGTTAEIAELMCTFSASSPLPGGSAAPCAIDLQVAGMTAVYLPESMGTLLYIEVGGDGLFNLQLVGETTEGVDKQGALVSIAELAIPRLGQLPVGTPQPEESFTTDAALEALFPSEIAGMSMNVDTRVGTDAEIDPDDPTQQAFLAALESQGKSIDDLSIGFGTNGSVVIVAIQVRGADISAFVPDLMGAFLGGEEMAQTPVQVAGKDVTEAAVNGQVSYVYPHGDVLWLVNAEEPALTEVFQKLP